MLMESPGFIARTLIYFLNLRVSLERLVDLQDQIFTLLRWTIFLAGLKFE
jgi:hypothetical protein